MSTVQFRCVKVGSKLRVQITSRGYNQRANCQFPRAIRIVGRTFSAPSEAVSFASGPNGTFFYRVRADAIRVLDAPPIEPAEEKVHVRVFQDGDECVVCTDAANEVVFIPCGHFCTCAACAGRIKATCPLCRAKIVRTVNRSEITEDE